MAAWRVLTIIVLILVALCLVQSAGAGIRLGAFADTLHAAAGGARPEVIWHEFAQPETECSAKLVAAVRKAAGKLAAGFGPATPEVYAAAEVAAASLMREFKRPVTAEQIVGVRNQEVAMRAQYSGVRALTQAPAISAAYDAGRSIVQISASTGLPPLAVARQLLLRDGGQPADVRRALTDPESCASPRLTREIVEASAADIGSRLHQAESHRRALEFEERVGRALTAGGVAFRDENALRAEGAPITPDFLLDSKVTIGGRRVFWIDAKNYTMYGSRLLAGKLAKQVARYTAAFGPGALVFGGGVLCGSGEVKKVRVVMLDGRCMPP